MRAALSLAGRACAELVEIGAGALVGVWLALLLAEDLGYGAVVGSVGGLLGRALREWAGR